MDYSWKEKRKKSAFLALENGEIFKGYSFGAEVELLVTHHMQGSSYH